MAEAKGRPAGWRRRNEGSRASAPSTRCGARFSAGTRSAKSIMKVGESVEVHVNMAVNQTRDHVLPLAVDCLTALGDKIQFVSFSCKFDALV